MVFCWAAEPQRTLDVNYKVILRRFNHKSPYLRNSIKVSIITS